MNPHLTSNMTAYTPLSSPCSALTLTHTQRKKHTHTHTHTHISVFLSSQRSHAQESLQLLSSFLALSQLHTHTHTHTHTYTGELNFERRQWEGRGDGGGKKGLEKCKICHCDLWWWQVWECCYTTVAFTSVWLPSPLSPWNIWTKRDSCLFQDVRGEKKSCVLKFLPVEVIHSLLKLVACFQQTRRDWDRLHCTRKCTPKT